MLTSQAQVLTSQPHAIYAKQLHNRGGVLAAWLLATACAALAGAADARAQSVTVQAQTPSPQARPRAPREKQAAPAQRQPPRVLNMVLVRLKRGTSRTYAPLEATIARAYERAKVNVYWVGLQSSKDPNDVLYLNPYDSSESADRVDAVHRAALKQHPELTRLQQRLDELVVSQTSMLTTRRDDVDQAGRRPDFTTMRALRLTIFHVTPGREGDFITAIRTTAGKDRPWLAYEANDTSTFALITPMRASRSGRRDGPAIPRTLRRFKGVYTKVDTRIYAVRPSMSHVSQTFAASNPQFWRPVAASLH
jgi:hypothetical protein